MASNTATQLDLALNLRFSEGVSEGNLSGKYISRAPATLQIEKFADEIESRELKLEEFFPLGKIGPTRTLRAPGIALRLHKVSHCPKELGHHGQEPNIGVVYQYEGGISPT